MNLNEAKQLLKKSGYAVLKEDADLEAKEKARLQEVIDKFKERGYDAKLITDPKGFLKVSVDTENNGRVFVVYETMDDSFVPVPEIPVYGAQLRLWAQGFHSYEIDELVDYILEPKYNDRQRVNEWVTPMRFSYIIKFGQIQGKWEEEVEVFAYSIVDAAQQAEKLRNESELYRQGAILSIRMNGH